MQASQKDLLPGGRRFRFISQLAEGSGGAVYAVQDAETGGRVALKVLRAADPEALSLLQNEFRAVAEICHPNLVRLDALREENGTWFFTMELVEGVDALAYVRPMPSISLDFLNTSEPAAANSQAPLGKARKKAGEQAALDEPRLRNVLGQLLAALSALHGAGKVHCAVKPANLLVTSQGRAVLLDFALLRAVHGSTTEARGLRGTLAHMAPEQVLGEPVGPAADLYGVGVFIYQALTGKLPFQGDTAQIMEAKQAGQFRKPSALAGPVADDLEQLCLDLLQAKPEQRPTLEQVLRRLGNDPVPAPPSAPFVGRRKELEQLAKALDDVKLGNHVSVVLRGSSGVGKSYLAREFIERTRKLCPELRVLRGKCSEQESAPYKALDAVVEELTTLLSSLPAEQMQGLLPPDVALLRPLFPVLGRIDEVAALRLPAELDANPHELRRRAVAALRELFTRIAWDAPLIIVVEDLHWANADSMQLLADLLRPPSAPPVLLLLTQRPVPIGALSAAEVLPVDLRLLELDNFPSEHAVELVERLLKQVGQRPSEALLHAVASDAGGHPFMIHELVVQRDSAVLHTERAPVDEALWRRICALSQEARSYVQLVSLAGIPLRQELLAEMLQVSLERMRELSAELCARALICTHSDVAEPYHDRVREAVAQRLPVSERRHLHRLLAATLERVGENSADVLMIHWEGAGDVVRARAALLSAAERAAEALAFDYAAAVYRRALAFGIDDAAQRREVLTQLAHALRNGGRGAEAAECYREAAELSDDESARDLRRLCAQQLLTSGEFVSGRLATRAIFQQEGMRMFWSPWLAVPAGFARRAWLAVRGLGFVRRNVEEIEPRLFREMDVLWDAIRGLCTIEAALLFDLGIRLVLLALKAGDPNRLVRYLSAEAMSVGCAGQLSRGTALLAHIRELLPQVDDQATHTVFAMASATLQFYENRWRSSADGFENAAKEFARIGGGNAWEVAFGWQFALIALFRSGQLRRMQDVSKIWHEDAVRRGDLFAMTATAVGYPALAHLTADRPEEGRECVKRLIERWPANRCLYQHYHALVYDAHADLYSGDARGAFERVSNAWRGISREMLLLFPEILHELLHLRARTALALAREQPASWRRRKLMHIAAADARKLAGRPLAWPRASAAQVFAGLAVLRGETDRARVHVEEAIRLYEVEADMPLYAAACRVGLAKLNDRTASEQTREQALQTFKAEGVVAPERFARMLATGIA